MLTNDERRAFADALAARVASLLGLPAPRCMRITRRRGKGYLGRFSVPGWIFQRAPAYRDYYIAHEVCHTGGNRLHDAAFKALEARAMESLGLQLQFASDRHAYPLGIADLHTGAQLCVKHGHPVSV